MDDVNTAFVIVLLAIAFVAGMILAHCWTTHDLQHEAIQTGAGEYYISSNYSKEFRWTPK